MCLVRGDVVPVWPRKEGLPHFLVPYMHASSAARAEVVTKAVVALRITHSFTVKKHTTLQNHAYGRFARHAVDKGSHEPFKC